MVVKIQNMKIVLLLVLLYNTKDISDMPCDQTLLKTFKLTGLKHASLQDKMHICSHVENNCCTLIDELSITKYWHEYSAPRFKDFVNGLMALYKNMFNYQKYISMIDFKHVHFQITKTKWVTYRKKYCSLLENVEEFKQFDPEKVLTDLNAEIHQEQTYHNELDTLTPDLFENMNDPRFLFLPSFVTNMFKPPSIPQPPPLIQNMLDMINPSAKAAEEAKKKALEEMKRKMEEERKAFEARKADAVAQMAKTLADNTVKSADDARKIYSKKFMKFLEESRQNLPKIRADHKEEIDKFIADGKIYIEDMPNQILTQAKEFHDFMAQLKAFVITGIKVEAEALKTVRMPDINRDYVKALLGLVNNDVFPSHALPNLPDMRRGLPAFPELTSSKVVCNYRTQRLYKYFMMVNSIKHRFCSKAHNNVLRLEELNMGVYLPKLRDEALTLFNTKRSLYCGVCDALTQKFFNYEHKIVYYSEDFCRNLINTHMDYIKFNNIIFVEYADEVLQYLDCVSSRPEEIEVPFKNIFHKLKKRIVFFNRCFNNVNRTGFMKHCHFICSKYNINGMHAFIEGDIHNAYLLYLRIVEFVREYKLPFDTKLEVNLETIERLNNFFYTDDEEEDKGRKGVKPRALGPAHNKEDDKKHDKSKGNDKKNAKNPKKPKEKKDDDDEEDGKKEKEDFEDNKIRFNLPIYKRIDKVVRIQRLEPVFLKQDEGFDPITTYYATDFQIDNKEYILRHFYKDGSDVLDKNVISSFFKIRPIDVVDFNSDIYVNLEDYDALSKKLPHQLQQYNVSTLPSNIGPQYGQSTYVPSTITPRADDEFKVIN